LIVDTSTLVVNATGYTNKVGIGTATPVTNLHVVGSSYPVFKVDRTTTATNSIGSGFNLRTITSGDMIDGFGGGFVFSIQDNAGVENFIGRIAAIRNGADNTGALRFDIGNGTTEAMRITGDGNVGIGTPTPARKLQVRELGGTSNHIADFSGSGSVSNYITVGTDSGARFVLASYPTRGRIETLGNHPLDFGVNDTVKMTLSTDGNFGIGTTTPGEKLEVTGNIKASGYKSSDGSAGVSGSFTTTDGKTITIKDGLVTAIV
jgi:hypothetical protein